MRIATRTATFRVDDIQAAYNEAVLSGRMPLAKEIEQLWLGAIIDQSARAEKRLGRHVSPCRHVMVAPSFPEVIGADKPL